MLRSLFRRTPGLPRSRLSPFLNTVTVTCGARTAAPLPKNVGASRTLKPVPSSLSARKMDSVGAPPANFSMDIVEPVFSPLAMSHSSELPQSLPQPPVGTAWQWLPSLRSAVPVPEDWSVWSGTGSLFGMGTTKIIVSADGSEPSVKSPHAVGLSLTHYSQAFTQSVIKSDSESLAQFLISTHMRRSAPPTPVPEGKEDATPEEVAEATKEWYTRLQAGGRDGTGGKDSMAFDNVPPNALPHVIGSWTQELTPGVTLYSIEYTMTHSDLSDERRRASGTHYQVTLVLNTLENCVFEVEFRAPQGEWDSAWAAFGEELTNNTFLNWSDESPMKFQ